MNYLFKKITGNDSKYIKDCVEHNLVLKEEFNKSKLDYKKPSIPVLEKVFSYLKGIRKEYEQVIEKILSFSKFLNEPKDIGKDRFSLADLRNNGRYAHGKRSTNEEILDAFGGSKFIVESVYNLFSEIFKEELDIHKEDIYTKTNELIIRYIKNEEKIYL